MPRGWHQVPWWTPVCSSSKKTRRLCCLSLLIKRVAVNVLSIQLHCGSREGNVLGQIGGDIGSIWCKLDMHCDGSRMCLCMLSHNQQPFLVYIEYKAVIGY